MHRFNALQVSLRAPCARFAWICVLGLGVTGAASAEGLPALLAHVTAGSGWDSACPGRNDSERAMIVGSKLAVSPELSARLERQFPTGSSESALRTALAIDGFAVPSACDADPTIMRAMFFQKGGGLLLYDVSASVYWKADGDGKIVWTKGFIFYSGL